DRAIFSEALKQVHLEVGRDEAAVVGLEGAKQAAADAQKALVMIAETNPDVVHVGRRVEHQMLPGHLNLRLYDEVLPTERNRIASLQRSADARAAQLPHAAPHGGLRVAVEPSAEHDGVDVPALTCLERGDRGDLPVVEVTLAPTVDRVRLELQLAVG